jgi:hypothetical protein
MGIGMGENEYRCVEACMWFCYWGVLDMWSLRTSPVNAHVRDGVEDGYSDLFFVVPVVIFHHL